MKPTKRIRGDARRPSRKRWGLAAVAAILVWAGAVQADVSEGHPSSEAITPGSLVATDSATAGAVMPATLDHADNLLGVAVNADRSLLATSTGTGKQVQVATSGTQATIVSTAGGAIKSGDKIAPSTVKGVGVKAADAGRVVGTAQADFAADTAGAVKQTVTIGGTSQEIFLGTIPVQVFVTYYGGNGQNQNRYIPKFIQELSNAVGGREVSSLKIILGSLIVFLTVLSVSVLLYGSARSSIISIGRNPLSKKAVQGSLIQVLGLGLIMLGAAVGAVVILFRV